MVSLGETLEGYGNVVVKVNPFIVEIDPPTVSAGDTARIIPKYVDENGNYVEYPESQTFELGMLDGCLLGKLNAGGLDTNYVYGVTQPFYFIVDTSADSGNVNIRVGVIDMNLQNRSVTNSNINIENDNTVEYCFLNLYQTSPYINANVVVGGCKQKTIICNNYQPPKFEDVGRMTELGESDPWQWNDEKGNPKSTSTGNACDYGLANSCDTIVYGKTYIMPKIGDYAIGNPKPPVYNLLDDMKITVCLDKSDLTQQYWNFSLENFRVPIFISVCSDQPQTCGFTDLGDGTNASLLNQYIKNCADYERVMIALSFWISGPQRMGGWKPPYKYYFSAGTIAHENKHLEQIKTKLFEFWNGPGGFGRLKNKKIQKNDNYKCPEDALYAVEKDIRDNLKFDLMYYFNDLVNLFGWDGPYNKAEKEADDVAAIEYNKIKDRIHIWATQQSWWCNPWPMVGDDYYFGCDKKKCTP